MRRILLPVFFEEVNKERMLEKMSEKVNATVPQDDLNEVLRVRREKLAALQAELQDRHIKLSKAGSIAEAALSVTNVFAEAQASADLYLQEIAQLKEETEKQCAQRIAEAEKSVREILEDGKEQCALLAERYKADYAQYQKLQAEIQSLKDLRKRLLYEGH